MYKSTNELILSDYKMSIFMRNYSEKLYFWTLIFTI